VSRRYRNGVVLVLGLLIASHADGMPARPIKQLQFTRARTETRTHPCQFEIHDISVFPVRCEASTLGFAYVRLQCNVSKGCNTVDTEENGVTNVT
jgi:hypothetical protein